MKRKKKDKKKNEKKDKKIKKNSTAGGYGLSTTKVYRYKPDDEY